MKFFRLLVLTAILLTINSIGFSQIGINTIAPDSSASLHIVSKPSGSGLLIPRLTQAQRLAIFNPAKGLMVFDLSANLFYMNMDTVSGDNWYAINPWLTQGNSSTAKVMYTSSVVSKVGIGTPTPSATLEVNGNIKSSTSVNTDTVISNNINATTLNVTGFPVNSLVPAGAIIMWSGTSAPSGWALCDGGGGRPDLRGRFVVGLDILDTDYDSDGKIGPDLTVNAVYTLLNGGKSIQLKTPAMPSHTHALSEDAKVTWPPVSGVPDGGANFVATSSTGTSGAQSVIPLTGVTDATGNGNAIENRPPYYVLAYIIKLP